MDRMIEEAKRSFPAYTQMEKDALAQKYTPAQMASIMAGEEAITAEDLNTQARMRIDPFMPQYLDDFSRIEKTIDKKIEKLRGEGQDYEHIPEVAQMPTAGEFALGQDAEQLFDAPFRTASSVEDNWGEWIESKDAKGNKRFDFRWNQDQLERLAEEDFFETPEGKELLTPVLEQRRATEAIAASARDLGASEEDIAHITEDLMLVSAEELKEDPLTARQIDNSDDEETDDLEEDEDGKEDNENEDEDEEDDIEEDDDEEEDDEEDEDDDDDSEVPYNDTRKGSPKLPRDEYLSRLKAADPLKYAAATQKPDLSYREHPVYLACRDHVALTKRPYTSGLNFGTSDAERRATRFDITSDSQPDVAPTIPKFHDPNVIWGPGGEENEEAADKPDETGGLEDEALEAYQRVAKSMGQTVPQLLKYRVKTLSSHRVVNQTRLGKIGSIYNLVVAGNGQGLVGLGEGKGAEGDEAVRTARLNAIRNMVPILRYENRTIYGDCKGKVGATEVQLGARRPGFGVRCNQTIFEIARCAGLFDLSARVPRSRNRVSQWL